MARTVTTNYLERALDPNFDLAEVRAALQQQYEIAQGDSDKAGDVEDAMFYDGQVDILTWVLGMLTVEPVEEKRERLERERGYILRLIDDTERDTPDFERLHKRADDLAQEIHDLDKEEK